MTRSDTLHHIWRAKTMWRKVWCNGSFVIWMLSISVSGTKFLKTKAPFSFGRDADAHLILLASSAKAHLLTFCCKNSHRCLVYYHPFKVRTQFLIVALGSTYATSYASSANIQWQANEVAYSYQEFACTSLSSNFRLRSERSPLPSPFTTT